MPTSPSGKQQKTKAFTHLRQLRLLLASIHAGFQLNFQLSPEQQAAFDCTSFSDLMVTQEAGSTYICNACGTSITFTITGPSGSASLSLDGPLSALLSGTTVTTTDDNTQLGLQASGESFAITFGNLQPITVPLAASPTQTRRKLLQGVRTDPTGRYTTLLRAGVFAEKTTCTANNLQCTCPLQPTTSATVNAVVHIFGDDQIFDLLPTSLPYYDVLLPPPNTPLINNLLRGEQFDNTAFDGTAQACQPFLAFQTVLTALKGAVNNDLLQQLKTYCKVATVPEDIQPACAALSGYSSLSDAASFFTSGFSNAVAGLKLICKAATYISQNNLISQYYDSLDTPYVDLGVIGVIASQDGHEDQGQVLPAPNPMHTAAVVQLDLPLTSRSR